MFLLVIITGSFIASIKTFAQVMNEEEKYTMLCLGDSYTIGEGVAEEDRFPNQAVLQLKSNEIYFTRPLLIAQTGWTTDELMAAVEKENILANYDFVTLLIGVNNQYRGRSSEDYRNEFSELLQLAIRFAGGKTERVIVLSIPDWGVTPFAEGRDRKKIAGEIDLFNSINKAVSKRNKVQYIDVTRFTRNHPDWLVEDKLHPSGKMYALWADRVRHIIHSEVLKEN